MQFQVRISVPLNTFGLLSYSYQQMHFNFSNKLLAPMNNILNRVWLFLAVHYELCRRRHHTNDSHICMLPALLTIHFEHYPQITFEFALSTYFQSFAVCLFPLTTPNTKPTAHP